MSAAPAGLDLLLDGLPDPVGQLCRAVVALVAGTKGLVGTVKPGWRSINFRHERAGHVCAVFPYADRVSIYFEHGRLLEDPEGLLEGETLKKGRVMHLYPAAPVPEAGLALLLAEAIALRC